MKQKILIPIILVFGIILGIAGNKYFMQSKSSEWMVYNNMPLSGSSASLGWTDEAFIGVDISLPKVKQIDIKIKFISPKSSSITSLKTLGFVANIDIEHLDKKDIPSKYLEEKKLDSDMTELPLEEVTYKAKFDFTLKDQDGFELTKSSSKEFYIQSGKVNIIQDTIKSNIPIDLIKRTKDIKSYLVIVKCISCY